MIPGQLRRFGLSITNFLGNWRNAAGEGKFLLEKSLLVLLPYDILYVCRTFI